MFKEFWEALKNPNRSQSSSLILVHAKFFLGLFPYRLEGPRESPTFVVRKVGFFLTLIYVLIFFGSYTSSYLKSNAKRRFFFNADISRFFTIIFTAASIVFMSITFMCSIIKRHALVDYFHKSFQLDRALRSFGYLIYFNEDTKLKRIGLVVLGVYNLIYVSYCIWFFLDHDIFKHGESFIVFFLPIMYLQLLILSFLSITLRTKHVISTLNKVSERVLYYP